MRRLSWFRLGVHTPEIDQLVLSWLPGRPLIPVISSVWRGVRPAPALLWGCSWRDIEYLRLQNLLHLATNQQLAQRRESRQRRRGSNRTACLTKTACAYENEFAKILTPSASLYLLGNSLIYSLVASSPAMPLK